MNETNADVFVYTGDGGAVVCPHILWSVLGLAGNVADMSPTCRPDTVMSADYARKGMSPRHKT